MSEEQKPTEEALAAAVDWYRKGAEAGAFDDTDDAPVNEVTVTQMEKRMIDTQNMINLVDTLAALVPTVVKRTVKRQRNKKKARQQKKSRRTNR